MSTRRAMLWLGTLLVSAGAGAAGCRRPPCAPVCQRVRECRAEVTRALVDRLPARSGFAKHVRNKLPERVVGRLVDSCADRCTALGRSKRWRERIVRCHAQKSCQAFARCVAPVLEP